MYVEYLKSGEAKLVGFIFIGSVKIRFAVGRKAVAFAFVRTWIIRMIRCQSISANIIV